MTKKRKIELLGMKMKRKGFKGNLSDYPTIQSRLDWIRRNKEASKYKKQIFEYKIRKKNPLSTRTLMALGLGFILGSKK